MKHTIPSTPFATRLSGSAKEIELRLRNLFQWKKKRSSVLLLLAVFLLTAGCGNSSELTAVEPSVVTTQTTDAPLQENVSPEKARTDATQEVLAYVDAVFSAKKIRMLCWIFPGTGPIGVPIEEYREQVREVFARYTWTLEENADPNWEDNRDVWHFNFSAQEYPNGFYNISARSNSVWLQVDESTSAGSTVAYYSYDGEPGSLNAALADLWGGPGIRYALVTIPQTQSGDQTLMEAYADAFRERYLASGAITDYELRGLDLLSGEASETTGDMSSIFTMTYAVQPADPTAPCWNEYTAAENGWITFSVRMQLELEEGVWRCAWYEVPDDIP